MEPMRTRAALTSSRFAIGTTDDASTPGRVRPHNTPSTLNRRLGMPDLMEPYRAHPCTIKVAENYSLGFSPIFPARSRA